MHGRVRYPAHCTCSGLKLRGPLPWVIICRASLSKATVLRYLPACTFPAIRPTLTAPAFRARFLPLGEEAPLGGFSLQ